MPHRSYCHPFGDCSGHVFGTVSDVSAGRRVANVARPSRVGKIAGIAGGDLSQKDCRISCSPEWPPLRRLTGSPPCVPSRSSALAAMRSTATGRATGDTRIRRTLRLNGTQAPARIGFSYLAMWPQRLMQKWLDARGSLELARGCMVLRLAQRTTGGSNGNDD
jgi:hypothetical protein